MTPSTIVETGLNPETAKSYQITPLEKTSNPLFNPKRHLVFSPPSTILQMKDLCLEPSPLSPIAASGPFPLLSYEAVLAHRRELFTKEVFDNCMYQARPGSVSCRGMSPRYAPFIYKFWRSPEVLRIVSDIAGVELIPAFDYEISHTNIQLGPGGLEAVRNTPVVPPEATEEAINSYEAIKSNKQQVTDQSKPIIEWHKDSYPWVCVVMLSDARHMSGGETELMKGDGTTIKIKAPQMGSAMMLQGRYIEHTAAPVTNMPERVTIVTSFRPKNPMLIDATTTKNVRSKSHASELFYQWTTYRLDVISQRTRITAEALKKKYVENVRKSNPDGKSGLCRAETVSYAEMQKWADDMITYIQDTVYEIRPPEMTYFPEE